MRDSTPLAGRHALVTGGSRGIGHAVASTLLSYGAEVTLMGRDAASLEKAVQGLGKLGSCRFVIGDVSQQSDVQRAFSRAREQAGAVHILVNNAGQAESERFDRLDEQAWNRMLAVNLNGPFHCIQAALPDMLAKGWGRVVNVASTAGLVGYPYVSAYCAAKHGVVGLTRALALEVASKGVTINAVCPGYTETDIVRDAVANITHKTGMTAAQARAKLAERNPQGRLVQPDEVAETVAWLCLPASGAVNGQAIPVDGGEVMSG